MFDLAGSRAEVLQDRQRRVRLCRVELVHPNKITGVFLPGVHRWRRRKLLASAVVPGLPRRIDSAWSRRTGRWKEGIRRTSASAGRLATLLLAIVGILNLFGGDEFLASLHLCFPIEGILFFDFADLPADLLSLGIFSHFSPLPALSLAFLCGGFVPELRQLFAQVLVLCSVGPHGRLSIITERFQNGSDHRFLRRIELIGTSRPLHPAIHLHPVTISRRKIAQGSGC